MARRTLRSRRTLFVLASLCITSLCITSLCIVTVCVVPMSASAQMTDEGRGRQHHEAGLSYYDQARFEDAAREFRSAYRLSGRHHLLLNVAASHEAAHDLPQAIAALDEYLQVAPDAEDRRTVEERVAQLRASLPPEPTTAEPPPPQTESPNLLAPVLLISSAAVLEIAALALGLAAHSTFTDLEEQCPERRCPVELEDDGSSGQTLATTSTVLTFVGGAIGVVGVILLAVELGSGGDEAATTALASGPGELGLSIRGEL